MGLLSTLTIFELMDFIMVMMEEINNERLYNYYLHKSTFSSISFEEFKDEQDYAQSQTYTPTETKEKTLKYANAIIEIREEEVDT